MKKKNLIPTKKELRPTLVNKILISDTALLKIRLFSSSLTNILDHSENLPVELKDKKELLLHIKGLITSEQLEYDNIYENMLHDIHEVVMIYRYHYDNNKYLTIYKVL